MTRDIWQSTYLSRSKIVKVSVCVLELVLRRGEKNQALPPTLDRILVPLGGTFSKFLTSAPSFLYGIPPRISVLYGEFSSWSLRQLFVISLSQHQTAWFTLQTVCSRTCVTAFQFHQRFLKTSWPVSFRRCLSDGMVRSAILQSRKTLKWALASWSARFGRYGTGDFTVVVSSQLCKRWSESITGELMWSGEYFSLLTPPLTLSFVQSPLVYFACNLTELKKLVGGKSWK